MKVIFCIYVLWPTLQPGCGTVGQNTAFVDNVTKILVPIETTIKEAVIQEEPIKGGVGVLDHNNRTYIDIIQKSGVGSKK